MIWTIPICHTECSDDWVWHFTKNGLFNIKSAYKLFINNSIEALPILCNGGKLSRSFPFQTRSRFSLGSYITTSFLLIKIYMLGRFS